MDTMVVVSVVRNGIGRIDALPFQVISTYPPVTINIILVIALIALLNSPVSAQRPIDPNDFAEVTVRTGTQLSGRLEQLLAMKNIAVAARYFEERKMKPL